MTHINMTRGQRASGKDEAPESTSEGIHEGACAFNGAGPDASHSRKICVVVHSGFSCVDVALIGQVIECANEVRVTGLRLERRYGLFVVSEKGGRIYSSSGIPVFSEPASCMEPDDAVIVLGPEAANPRFRGEAQPWLQGANVQRAVTDVSSGEQSPVRRTHPDESPERFAGTSNPAEYRVDRRAALRAALLIVEHDMGRAAARRVGERVLPGSDRWLAALLGEPDDSSRAKVMQAARWIDENCGRPITVGDVCLYVSMTAWTLARHFRATVGMSPAAYLQSARFERACRLLADTHLPIDKVARRCGLGGGMALAKLFQRRLALSPSAYRRSLNPEEMPAATDGDSEP